MKLLFAIVILFFSHSVFSQTENRKSKKDFDKILAEQSKFITDCETKTKESQIKEFGKVLPKIAGECEWSSNGCPIKLVKPIYPESARKRGLSGAIKIEIIIDETGKTVYAKAVKGKKVFYQNAERAALLSQYYPKTVCGKSVWQRKYIIYNFISD